MTSLKRLISACIAACTTAVAMTISVPAAQAMSSLTPSPRQAARGDTVTITGDGFGPCPEASVLEVQAYWDQEPTISTVELGKGTSRLR